MYIQGSPAPAAPAAPVQVTPAQPAQPAQTYQPQTYTPPPVVQVNPNPAPSPVPAGDVEIIGLPDRSSGKIYRLQVGAYSTQSAAVKAAQLVQAAGLNPVLEQYDSKYRVLAAGIAAANVYPACLRLGSMGFRQIWVRE
jgi:cell division protein FtsN